MGTPIKCDCESDARDRAFRRRYRGPRWYGQYPVQSFSDCTY
jgi:hypothetical protein